MKKIQIYVKDASNNEIHTFNVEKNIKIAEFKQDIRRKFNFENNEKFKLYENQRELDDNKKIENEVKNFTFLKILKTKIIGEKEDEEEILLHFKFLTGECFQLMVNPKNSIDTSKHLLKDLTGIEEENLRMICAGRGLETFRTYEHFNIRDGALIHCVMRINNPW